jgi:hypothetical protein
MSSPVRLARQLTFLINGEANMRLELNLDSKKHFAADDFFFGVANAPISVKVVTTIQTG